MRRAGEQGKGTLFERIVSNRLIGLEDGGETLVLGVDQVLLQDATGTLTVQALDALALERVVPGIAVQYVDHNLMQGDFRNADDHRYLRESAAARGIHYSPPGNGISHPVHMELYGRPGYVLVGSDSHTCAAGAIGMLALGLGSLTVAAVLAGAPLRLRRPRVIGVVLQGRLTPGVSAKDVILDVLRRIGTAGGANAVLEYHGPGVATLDAWDRHVIANMGAETGAVTSLFPSDARTAAFLTQVGRSEEMTALDASPEAAYTEIITIDLAALEPLIALPSSPGNVVPVREVEGTPLGQVYLGSSANPGLRDFAAAAAVLGGARIAEGLTLEVNPTTRTVLRDLMASGLMTELIEAGGRLHQTGCNGCNGMGQAPGTGMNSLRTVPRNFPGRSGTREDRVYLCGPETAAASALNGRITDPRRYADRLAAVSPPPGGAPATRRHIVRPPGGETGERFIGPNILPIPVLPPFDASIDVPVILSLGDDVSTDEISPAGAAALPFRSNLERLADFTFHPVDPDYVGRARATTGGHAILAGRNYGQGSSREHAALCPRLLGLKLVVAESFARIHRENLIAAGILPARSEGAVPEGVTRIQMTLDEEAIERGRIEARLATAQGGTTHNLTLDLSEHERAVLMSGGLLYHLRRTDGAHRKAG